MDGQGLTLVRVPGWEEMIWLRHGFSTRLGGLSMVYGDDELNLGFTKDDDAVVVAANRRLLMEAVGGDKLETMRQVHGNVVRTVQEADYTADECDGLITETAGVLLGVLTADCVPVLVVDPVRRAVGAFHAGWRGTVAGIVERGVAKMEAEFGSKPEDLRAAVGPAIGVCCYRVGQEVRERFGESFGYAGELFVRGPRLEDLRVDLAEANRRQLVGAGVAASNVWVARECTACTRWEDGRWKYFSHRAEGGFTGRMMGVVGVVG